MNTLDRKQSDSIEHNGEASIVQIYLLHLNARGQGIATGVFMGFSLFVITIWLVVKGGEHVGPHLALLGQYFIGYRVTWLGGVIGLGYGFVVGFLIGYGYALVYNWVLDKKMSHTKE